MFLQPGQWLVKMERYDWTEEETEYFWQVIKEKKIKSKKLLWTAQKQM